MNEYDNGQIIDLVLSQEQRDQVQPILSAHAADAANVMFISSFPKDLPSWLWKIIVVRYGLGQKLLRALKLDARHQRMAVRIQREAPAIAKRMADGQYRSVRAAGIVAGIVKARSPLDDLRAAWRRSSAAEKGAFLSEIQAISDPKAG